MRTAAWEVVKMQRERLEEWQRMMDISDCQNPKNDVFRRSLRQHVSEKICL